MLTFRMVMMKTASAFISTLLRLNCDMLIRSVQGLIRHFRGELEDRIGVASQRITA
jgi:hypothetical protein